MSPSESSLWHKVREFSLDKPGESFLFSDRLARENGWSKTYALRAIEEYKKFLFLCCVTGSGLTPSDPVDQVWHLHLSYTRSYWIDLCRNTPGRDIHHNPTRGGESEGQKFKQFYATTHAVYKEKLGTPPPKDIWHDQHTRFTDIHFQRGSRQKHWIIKKPALPAKPHLILSCSVLVALISIQAMLDLPNLLFLGFVAVMCIVVYRNQKNDGDSSGCSSGCSGCGGGND